MIIELPEPTIEPFGYTGVPTVLFMEADPELLKRLFAELQSEFDFMIKHWELLMKNEYPDERLEAVTDLSPIHRLHMYMAGAKESKFTFKILREDGKAIGFWLTGTFTVPGCGTTYGEMLSYTHGEKLVSGFPV